VQVQASIMERDSMYKRLRDCLADVATASDSTCTGIFSELLLSAQGIMVAPNGVLTCCCSKLAEEGAEHGLRCSVAVSCCRSLSITWIKASKAV
jgi:hypothetical protein